MASSTSIKKVKVSDLIPYANNSRLHSDEQVLQIASSIKEFGFLNPIIIDGDNGIIAGHGRVMAAKKLGIEELPCIDASHLTEAQKKAYVIADNKLALNSEWDYDVLRIELNILDDFGFDLDLTGFSADELDALTLDDELETGDQEHDEIESQQGYERDEFSEDDEDGVTDLYTHKTASPVYTIKGDCPELGEIYDKEKYKALVSAIEQSNVSEDIKLFLNYAATRHIKFNYEKIAEFYAHQNKEVQALMENSALVIIDFDKAIENGFVKLSSDLIKIMESQKNEE